MLPLCFIIGLQVLPLFTYLIGAVVCFICVFEWIYSFYNFAHVCVDWCICVFQVCFIMDLQVLQLFTFFNIFIIMC